MGVGEDPALGNSISVTIIATGFNSEQQHEIVNTEAKKIIHTLEEEQPLVHDLTEAKATQNIFEAPIEETPSKEPIVKYKLEEEVEETSVFKAAHEEAPLDQATINAIDVNDYEVIPPLQAIEVEDPLVVAPEIDPIIPTTNEITEIEVIAEQVISHAETATPAEEISIEDDFVFNEVNTALNEIEVVDHEMIESEVQQQIQFEFELPLQREDQVAQVETPTEELEESFATVFQLEEIEEETSTAKKEKTAQAEINEIELKVIAETPEAAVPNKLPEGSSPFDQSIRESISLQNEKRKEQLKQFNYTFNNNINRIEEMERQPAYKRLGFELDGPIEEQAPSTMSLDNDSNDEIQLRSNNSFLHDNVD